MKYCSNCGIQHEENTKFCTSCGAKFESEVETAKQEVAANLEIDQNLQQPVMGKSKKIFKLKMPILIVAVIVLIGMGAAAAVLLNKSPKDLYLLAEYKSYQQMIESVDKEYGDSIEFQKKVMEQPSSNEVTLSGNFEIDSLEADPDVQLLKDILSEASITAESEVSPLTNEGFYSLGINVAKEEAIDIEVYQSTDQFGLKVPLLYEKFLFLNFNQFGEFMRMTDPAYNGPETLELSKLEFKELQLTDKEKEHLQKRYSEFLLSKLKDEQFSVNKGINYEEMKLTKVTFELSPSETNQLLVDFIDSIIDDKKLHSMIMKRVEKLAENAAVIDDVNQEDFNAKELEAEFIQGLKDVKSDLKDVKFPEGFKSVLLIDNNEQIIDRNMTVVINDGSEPVKISILGKNVPSEDNKRMEELEISLTSEDEDYKMAFEMSNEIENEKSDNKVEGLNLSFYSETYGELDGKIDLDMTSKFKGKQGSKQTINREFKLNASGGEFSDVPSGITGTIVETRDINLKKEYLNQKYDVEINVEDEYDSGTVMLTVDSKTQLKKKADMPKLDSESTEAINVAEITEEQIYEIQEAVGTNIITLAEKFGLSSEDLFGYEEEYYEDEYYEDAFYDEGNLESY